MKKIGLYKIAWIIVGCIFAEAAFMIVQIGLTVLFSNQHHTLNELSNPKNPLYSVTPYFLIVGCVFLAAIIIGELKHIKRLSYYVLAALIAASIYYVALHINGQTFTMMTIILNIVASAVSGFVYWVIVPRRLH